MKLAFCLFKYFPYGGLQRDFFRIAKQCHEHGHSVDIYTMDWQGEAPEFFNIHLIKRKGKTNHAQAQYFSKETNQLIAQKNYDRVIGFNKMPDLDVYYAADSCFACKPQYQTWFRRLTKRYKTYSELEKSVFSPDSKTEILLISAPEMQRYQQHYQTQKKRLHLLPPGINKDRIAPVDAHLIRRDKREELVINDDVIMLLSVGSSFRTKGVDRSIEALASLKQNAHLFIAGTDKTNNCQQLVKKLNLDNQVTFMGPRDDISELLLAADLLLHPARNENTGTALLEAMVAGLPVLASACCGYASYIQEASAGMLIPEPFSQENYNNLLDKATNPVALQEWKHNALEYSKTADLFSLIDRAVEFIESYKSTKT